jgi:hypothetical protein
MSTSRFRVRPILLAALADVLIVLLFAFVGRSSHAESVDLLGVLITAWPFAAGLAVGWFVIRAWRAPATLVPTGLGVWGVAVCLGLVLRLLSGQGNALGFVVVTTVVLGVGLLGWRLCTRLVVARRRNRANTTATSVVG